MYKVITSRTPKREYKLEFWKGEELIDVRFEPDYGQANRVLTQSGAPFNFRGPRFPLYVGDQIELAVENPRQWFWDGEI